MGRAGGARVEESPDLCPLEGFSEVCGSHSSSVWIPSAFPWKECFWAQRTHRIAPPNHPEDGVCKLCLCFH